MVVIMTTRAIINMEILSAVIGGGFFCLLYPRLKRQELSKSVMFDKISKKLIVSRRTVFGKKSTEYSFGQVDDILILENKDDDGDIIYSLGIALEGRTSIKFDESSDHKTIQSKQENIALLKDFIGFSEKSFPDFSIEKDARLDLVKPDKWAKWTSEVRGDAEDWK